MIPFIMGICCWRSVAASKRDWTKYGSCRRQFRRTSKTNREPPTGTVWKCCDWRLAATRLLFILLGGDSLTDFPTWRRPERICELATLVVVNRPDSPEPDFQPLESVASSQRLTQMREHAVEMPLIGLSSTDIRHRAAGGQSIRYRTPAAVAKYIQTHALYSQSDS